MTYAQYKIAYERSVYEGTDEQGILSDEYPKFHKWYLNDFKNRGGYVHSMESAYRGNDIDNERNMMYQKSNNNFNKNQNMANKKPYQKNASRSNSGGQKAVKHSGAKLTKYYPETGVNKGVEQYLVTGWKLAQGALISVKAVTTNKSVCSDNGWFGSVGITVLNTSTGQKQFYWGTMEKSTGKVVINDLAWVLNPKAPNGGYCGTYIK